MFLFSAGLWTGIFIFNKIMVFFDLLTPSKNTSFWHSLTLKIYTQFLQNICDLNAFIKFNMGGVILLLGHLDCHCWNQCIEATVCSSQSWQSYRTFWAIVATSGYALKINSIVYIWSTHIKNWLYANHPKSQ